MINLNDIMFNNEDVKNNSANAIANFDRNKSYCKIEMSYIYDELQKYKVREGNLIRNARLTDLKGLDVVTASALAVNNIDFNYDINLVFRSKVNYYKINQNIINIDDGIEISEDINDIDILDVDLIRRSISEDLFRYMKINKNFVIYWNGKEVNYNKLLRPSDFRRVEDF